MFSRFHPTHKPKKSHFFLGETCSKCGASFRILEWELNRNGEMRILSSEHDGKIVHPCKNAARRENKP